MQIPQSLLSLYESFADDFINSNFGVNCTIYFPDKTDICPNCIIDTMTRRSSNVYKTGGPEAFTNGMLCPVCNGEGYKKSSVTEVIKLKVYYDRSKWVKIADNINAQNATAQIFGMITNMSKIQQMDYILLDSDYQQNGGLECVLDGPVHPFGLTNKYFSAYVKLR